MSLYPASWYALYAALALGIPGNILSAIVWLRRRVVSKNSSAVYLAALSINDLAFLLSETIFIIIHRHSGWFEWLAVYLLASAENLEPLIVLGFSIERLIAILRPLQVSVLR